VPGAMWEADWEKYYPIQELKARAPANVRTLNTRAVRMQFLTASSSLLFFFPL